MSVALGPVTLAGMIVETDDAGLATAVTIAPWRGFGSNLIAGHNCVKRATSWLVKSS